jgi:hypothetical protein
MQNELPFFFFLLGVCCLVFQFVPRKVLFISRSPPCFPHHGATGNASSVLTSQPFQAQARFVTVSNQKRFACVEEQVTSIWHSPIPRSKPRFLSSRRVTLGTELGARGNSAPGKVGARVARVQAPHPRRSALFR